MRSPFRSRLRAPVRSTVLALGVALAIGLLPQYVPEAAASDGDRTRSGAQTNSDDPVRGKDIKARAYGKPDPAAKAAVKSAAETDWPKAASDEVGLPAVKERPVKAAGLPVEIAATGTTSPDSVRVAVLDRKKAQAAGVDGVLLTVARADGAASRAPVRIALDYTGFADAYGAGYGSRLRLVRFPACVLTTPLKKACSTPEPLDSTNDAVERTLTARVAAAADSPGLPTRLGTTAADSPVTVLAATAAASGDHGDFGATSLQPSSQWSVSTASGAFNWSYPITAPPVPGGLAPQVALGYTSQSIDGQTATTNNQGSWVGQGFSYEPGFIERRYKPCSDDGHDDTNGDQCWGGANATISLASGSSGELVKDDTTGEWRIASDDFSKVEELKDATNGDNNGEHWKVTSDDGTQYYFGLNQLPGFATGNEETDSTWTAPVYGDDSGEPCYDATFANAFCTQAWRWNLDYVVDPQGNAMSYFYNKETNHYTQGLKTGENGKSYVRGGYLKRADYGQRAGEVYGTKASARIVFGTEERCIGDLTDCSVAALTDSTAADWPDVPWDRNCKADTKCVGQNSPTFWTRKQLAKITTQVRSGDSSYEDVDAWALGHLFTDNGDASKSLWLDSIDHTGLVGTDVSVPSVKLHGKQLANRVDVAGDNIQPFIRFRMSSVENGSGGVLSVNYADAECKASSLPAPGKSTAACYPVKWHPPGVTDPISDWFHKYVVASVVETDLVGGSPDQVTSYTYVGDAGWRKAKPDGLSKTEYLTWSDWRGYQKVRVETSDGSTSASNTRAEHVFFQGLDGDTDPDGGTKSSSVTDSTGTSHPDSDWKSGLELETLTYDGTKVDSKTVNTVWSKVTATRVKDWGTRTARFIRPARTDVYTALASGGWRQVATSNSYDDTTGRITQVADYGETGVADNQCIRSEYADNAAKHMYAYVSRVETVAVDCGTTPDRSKNVISDDLTLYDGSTGVGTEPTSGSPTVLKRLSSHSGTAATYQTVSTTTYDKYGRPLTLKDAKDTPKTITYTDTYGLATSKKETNNLGWVATTEYAPQWGRASAQVDVNNKRTDLAYDGMGRLTSVWFPDRAKASYSPSIKYAYGIRTTDPSYVRTERVENGGTYGSEYTLYDGLLRPRQIQAKGQNSGRLIADTYYDGSGRIVKSNGTYYAKEAPTPTLFAPLGEDIDAQTVTEFDGVGRTTASVFKVAQVEKYRTTYAYGGDRVHVDPPTGETATTTITDARQRTVELRQYKGAAPVPSGTSADYTATSYRYTPAGELAEVKDSGGNAWTYEYDQRHRKVRTVDPDTGEATSAYDDLDRLTSVTDSRKNTTTTVYDSLSRPVSTWQGAADTGTKLSVTRYDTAAKGVLYGVYSYKDGAVHSSVTYPVLEENNDYKPSQTSYFLSKTAEPELGGTYQFNTQYYDDGTVSGQNFPAAGGLAAESVSYMYDSLQRPTALNTSLGGGTYVPSVSYSPTNQLEGMSLTTGGSSDKKTSLHYQYEQGTQRLTNARVVVEGASSLAYDADYTYDAAGNVLSIVDDPTGGTRDAQCFAYDNLRRTTENWTSKVTPDGKVGTGSADTACASAPSSATVGGTAPYWHSYGYDALNNRTSETAHGISDTATSTKTYKYGENGEGPHQLTKVVAETTATSTTPAVTSQNTYSYDAAGNTETRVLGGDTQSLAWDKQNDLTKVTNADGTESSYVYDASGSRVLRKSASETTFYLPGMELRLDKSAGGVKATRYYSIGGQTVAVRDTDGVTFLAGDHHGTAQLAVDAVTGETQRRRLDPFGNGRDTDSSDLSKWVDDKGFVGGTNDETSGLVRLGAREYDASIGRFVSADPVLNVDNPQQINGYAYGNNNPVTIADPTGMCAEIDCPTRPCAQCENTTPGVVPGPPRVSANAAAAGITLAQAIGHSSAAAVKQREADAAKQRAIAVAKELGKIIADELGLTDALDCFTTGSLGACGATVVNVVSSVISGGPIGRLVAKYWYRVDKAWALGKRIVALGKQLWGAFKDWKRTSRAASSAAESCSVNSFTPGTRVLMADGTTKAIRDVDIGDKVRATDPETGETSTETVTAEIKGKGVKHLVKVTIDTDGKKGDKIASVTATDGHPFWVPELGEWIDATALKAGEWLSTGSGARVQIGAVKRWTAPTATVHNLTVSDLHTYYVLAGATPVLVHNCGGGAADLGHLTDRADDLHSLIPSGGQRYRTTGVLHADGVGGGIDLSAVGARSNLTLIQRADSLDAGELAISMSNGAHAEVKLVTAAQHLGLSPGGIAASRPFCSACSQFLTNQGATLVSPRTALWLPPGVR
ncbi:polymorphic toxin-type HINT domain-containing protein [Streptomyces sp. NPDC087844]|uniref:polymorphic toxin-type HINT domain-containing protein n=1 Tax=Streptomyces sp. NPDC087844 TaxID=3365805 RepID=UPI0037F16D52